MKKPLLCFLAVLAPSCLWSQILSENFDSYSINATVPGWTYQTPNGWSVQEDTTLDPSAPSRVFFNNSSGQQNIGIPVGSVVSLTTPGEYLELSFDYRYSAAPSTPGMQPFNFVRFGLYSSNGTAGVYADDIGYIGDISYWTENSTAPKSGDFSIRKEANVYEAFTMGILLDNESATNFGPPPTPETGDILTGKSEMKDSSHGEDGISNHSAKLRLLALPLGGYAQLYWDGNVMASDLDIAPLTAFDTIYLEAPSDNNGFAIDNLLLASGTLPTIPSTMTYTGGGGNETTSAFPLTSLEFTNTVYGRYILQGESLLLGGTLTNNSSWEHEIASGVQLVGDSEIFANAGNLTFSNQIALNGFDVDVFASEEKRVDIDSNVIGTGNLTKTGNGTLRFLQEPFINGVTIVSAGTLEFYQDVNSQGFVMDPSLIDMPEGAASEIRIENGATLLMNLMEDLANDSYSPKISGSGNFVKKGPNTISVGENFQFTGSWRLDEGAFHIEQAAITRPGSGILNGGHLVIGTAEAPVVLDINGDLEWASEASKIKLVNGSSLSIGGNFTDGGNGGNRTFNLNKIGKSAGTYELARFNGTTSFADTSRFIAEFGSVSSNDGFVMENGVLSYTINQSATTTGGSTLDNDGVPEFADFSASGDVVAGTGTNIINSVDFDPGSKIEIPTNGVLQITSGNIAVGNGSASINGGTIMALGDLNKQGGGSLSVDSQLMIPGTVTLSEGTLNINGTLQANKVVIAQGASIGGSGRIISTEIETAPNAPLVIPTGGLTVSGGKIPVAAGTTVVSGGTVTTPGNFDKQGAGELDVESNLDVGGTAVVDEGLLSVNGQLSSQEVVVDEGATLGGNGTIVVAQKTMTLAGVLSPGNSPGVISIQANPVMTSTGTILIEVESPTVFDRVVIDGSITLNGTLSIVPFGGASPFAYGQQYNFLTATGGITGEFDTITAPDTFRGRFLNGGTTGTLLIAPDTYTRVAETPNQRSVAKALDKYIPATSGDRETVSIALDLQTAEQYPAAFEQIMPGFYESLADMSIQQAFTQTQQLNQRMGAVRAGIQSFQAIGMQSEPLKHDRDGKSVADTKTPIVEDAVSTNWNSWVMGTGSFSRSYNLSESPGYKNDAGGFLAGADYRWSEAFSTGLYAGYQYNYAKYGGGSSTRGNSALFGAYASWQNEDGYYVNSVIGGGYTGYQTRRSIKFSTIDRTARANPNSGQFSAALNLGKDFEFGNWTLGPIVGAQYTYAGVGGFAESGADSLDLALGQQNANSLRSTLGGRVAYTWQVAEKIALIPEARMLWMHEFMNNPRNINSALDGGSGPAFGYETGAPYRNSVFAGAGVSAQIGDRWNASVFYNVNFGAQTYLENSISASLNFAF